LFFTGQVISTIGTWMQSIAQPWLVLQLTHNGLWVGLVLAMQFTPVLVAGPVGGLVADRFPKRRILQVTQTLFIIPAFFLFVISYTHVAQVWMVFCSALVWGTIQLFDVPARQAFVIEMVGREDLTNAIALNSSVFNGAAVIGPSLAGVIIGAIGVPACFLINAVSFLAAIAALALMRNLPVLVPVSDRPPAFQRIKEGAAYAFHDPLVGPMLLVLAIFSLFAMNRLTLIPLFADQVLDVGATGFGFLMAALGLGALTGALTVATFDRSADGNRQFWVAVAWGVALVLFSLSRTFWLSAALLFVAGFCQISFLAVANSRIQTATPDALRGRVMALYAQALMGVGPIGSTQAGALSSWLGAPWAMAIGASIAGLTVVAVRVVKPAVFTRPATPEDQPIVT
jgi:MFS family permease